MRCGKTPRTKILGGMALPGKQQQRRHSCSISKARENESKAVVKAVQRAPIETGPRSPAIATIVEKSATDGMNVQQKTMENQTKAAHPKVKAKKGRARAKAKRSTPRASQKLALYLSPQDLQSKMHGG